MCHSTVLVPPCLQLMSLRLTHVALRPARYYYLLQGPWTQGRPRHSVVMHQSDDTSQAYSTIPNTRFLSVYFSFPLLAPFCRLM